MNPVCFAQTLPWEDPFSLYLRLREEASGFLLESIHPTSPGSPNRWDPHRLGAYSFIGTQPWGVLAFWGTRGLLQTKTRMQSLEGAPHHLLERCLPPPPQGLPPDLEALPFLGGAVGYLGYGLVPLLHPVRLQAPDDLALPDACFLLVDTLVVLEHHTHRAWAVALGGVTRPQDPGPQTRLEALLKRLQTPPAPLPSVPPISPDQVVRNLDHKAFLGMVHRCKDYIAAGHIYQANLSQRFSFPVEGMDPAPLYQRLRAINPSPFAGILETPWVTLVSVSPERLVRRRGNFVETRPIAGTRPRGSTPGEEALLSGELLVHPKERAEHLMLVDLERNDLGRIAQIGTIQVDEFMSLEAYSHVWHIVSNIRGRVSPETTFHQILQALFPGGTVTGVPKIRCMEIIDELEPTARGPYTGAMGYLDLRGHLDFNILIRTLVWSRGWAHLQVGAGIVADSDPEQEYRETLHKAEALLQAFGLRGEDLA